MKVSISWLQKYFDESLPIAETIADALTFHAFEIEEATEDMLDVKVLPDRAGYALSHRGIAKELSAILQMPITHDPLRDPLVGFPSTESLQMVADETYVLRHMGALVSGVQVQSSPEWLKKALESVGQRSINNIVDATNYVMLDLGQPLHAFDAGKIAHDGEKIRIEIRSAKDGEKVTILSGEEYILSPKEYVIADAVSGLALDIAGIKGGLASGVTEKTTELFISVGNYDGTLLRKAAQRLKIFTDASQRYQNKPSPELTAYGMRAILSLIKEVAGGELLGVVDISHKKPDTKEINVTVEAIGKRLGIPYSEKEVGDVFDRLDLPFKKEGSRFIIAPPFERTDLNIPEDLCEEVGRILGYDRIKGAELPPADIAPDQSRYRGIERMKDQLVEKGFVEISTQSFVKKGERMLANPLDKTRPALRKSLEETLGDALASAKHSAPLVLPPNVKPKLFEVGTVFSKEDEHVELRMTERVPEWGDAAGISDNLSIAKLDEYGKDYVPKRYHLSPYKPFSPYPFIARDVALWVSEGTSADEVSTIIRPAAGVLLVRLEQFDSFSKDGKTSYAFRLVFQSTERTLTDNEINGCIEKVAAALAAKGWTVR